MLPYTHPLNLKPRLNMTNKQTDSHSLFVTFFSLINKINMIYAEVMAFSLSISPSASFHLLASSDLNNQLISAPVLGMGKDPLDKYIPTDFMKSDKELEEKRSSFACTERKVGIISLFYYLIARSQLLNQCFFLQVTTIILF